MAIFTSKADADLPILTQAYQLDTENEAEMLAFYASRRGEHSREWVKIYPEIQEDVTAVGLICQILQSVFDERFFNGGIRWNTREAFNQFLRGHSVRYHIAFNDTENITAEEYQREQEIMSTNGIIPAGKHRSVFYGSDGIAGSIGVELARLINDMNDGTKTLSQCEECKSIFARSGTRKQAFCSYRCQRRIASRRFRDKEKILYSKCV